MRATHTCRCQELFDFADSYRNSYGYKMLSGNEIKEKFFQECQPLVIFERQWYVDMNKGQNDVDENGNDNDNYDYYAGIIVAFLDHHKITECLVTGPRFYG